MSESNVTKNVPQGLLERFDLDPGHLVPLAGGYSHGMFRHGDLVIRFEENSWPGVRWEHDLVCFFAKRTPEVQAPLAFEDGVSIWPYVEGRPARRNHEPHAVAAAELLGRLHRAALKWYELANAVWEFCKSKRTHDFDRRLARSMIEAYGSDVTPEALVPLIIHRRRLEVAATGDENYRRHTARAIENLSR